jgi:hypothetical protein
VSIPFPDHYNVMLRLKIKSSNSPKWWMKETEQRFPEEIYVRFTANFASSKLHFALHESGG